MGLTLSFEETRDLLQSTLNAGRSGDQRRAWIRSVYPGKLVYEDESAGAGLWQRTYTLGDDGKVTLGNAENVIAKREYAVVKMAATGEWTKVFEAGDYPEKDIEFTADEVAAMASVRKIDVNHGHPSAQGPLDGKFGDVELKAGKDGILFGRWNAPKWIKQLLTNDEGGVASGVSLEINRETKLPDKASLVLNPRVTGAALVAAFSADEPPRKSSTVSTIAAALKALFGAAREEGILTEDAGGSDTPTTVDFANTPEGKRLRAENEALKAERDQSRTGQIGTLAIAFAEDALKEQRITPAEKDGLAAMFAQALKDDVGDKALFSGDGTAAEGERVKALRKSVEARPKLAFKEDQLTDASVIFAATGGTPKGPLIDPAGIYARRKTETTGGGK